VTHGDHHQHHDHHVLHAPSHDHNDGASNDHHDLLIAEPWGAQGGTLAQVMDDPGAANGRPVNATASALL
jgi:hypothetical protein